MQLHVTSSFFSSSPQNCTGVFNAAEEAELWSRPENYGRNPAPSNAGGNGAQPFRDRRRSGWLRISLAGQSHPWVFKERTDSGILMAADLTGESWLQIRDVIGPTLGTDHNRLRALVVAAVDDEPAWTGLAHFPVR
jgi:hypothetical protein